MNVADNEVTLEYDEEDDGFMFARAKGRKPRPSASINAPVAQDVPAEKEKAEPATKVGVSRGVQESGPSDLPKKRRNKMSFSTPNRRLDKPVRRSKRLSDEAGQGAGSPPEKVPKGDSAARGEATTPRPPRGPSPRTNATNAVVDVQEEHSETKIALPFADTPVIRKNKAMRSGNSGKSQRRSSLGLRGRRASSLIDSGSSNGESAGRERQRKESYRTDQSTIALPHSEVAVTNYYKHIESDGLTEPRRMRQLLIWCATKALEKQQNAVTQTKDANDRDRSASLVGAYLPCLECE